ncbi:MAG: transposase family protein [Bacteroides sp.]|nr:transposase family protein [Bacteroides sp.]
MTQTTSPTDFFASVSDSRVERTQKYSLDSILFISLCAVICGAESCLPNSIPLHDTFNRIISMLDSKEQT